MEIYKKNIRKMPDRNEDKSEKSISMNNSI